MIKVIHIITRMDRGGSAQNTLLTCHELSEKYELILAHGLSLESNMTDREKHSVDKRIEKAKERGVRVIPIPSLVRRIDPVQDLRTFFSLWKLMVHEKPVIVHTHTYKAGILGCWAAKIAGVPIIVHTSHGHVFFGHFSPLVSRLFLMIEKLTAYTIDRMVALSEGERNDYIAFSISKPDKIVKIHSGVEIDRFLEAQVNIEEKKKSLGLNPESLVVGTVGWLLPVKGPMYLLKAMVILWRSHPKIRLVFIGKGELENELKAEAFRIGISDRITFLGWREDIPEVMQILDIFVLASLNEGMGRVLVEAMSLGKPIVASDVGGIPDLVIHGKNGFLVPPKNPERLAKYIKILIEDKDKREKMGQAGKEMASHFSKEKMVKRIAELYEELVTHKNI